MIWLASPAAVLAGMALFGAGFGVVENSHLRAADRAAARGQGERALDLAYDAGYGVGPACSACSAPTPATRPGSP